MSQFADWSLPVAFCLVLAVLLSTGGYLLGMFYLYESAAGAGSVRPARSRSQTGLGRVQEVHPVEVGTDSNLARRSRLSGPDAAAARTPFTPVFCEALEHLVARGVIDGGPGILAIHGNGFPLPWKLKDHRAWGDEIRKVFASQKKGVRRIVAVSM